jgi:flagellar protein FlaG
MQIDSIQRLQPPSIPKISNTDSNAQGVGYKKNADTNTDNSQVQIKTIDTSGEHERNVDDDELQKSIEKMLKTLEGDTTSLKFDIHKETNTIMVKVIDNDTQKVIREIPSEKLLDMIASIWKLVGIIVDKKV